MVLLICIPALITTKKKLCKLMDTILFLMFSIAERLEGIVHIERMPCISTMHLLMSEPSFLRVNQMTSLDVSQKVEKQWIRWLKCWLPGSTWKDGDTAILLAEVSGIWQSTEGRKSRVTLVGDLMFDKQMENQKSDLNYWMMGWDGGQLACFRHYISLN